MHIQCSDATYQLLDKLGGFQLENRGVIEVKVWLIANSVTNEGTLLFCVLAGQGSHEHMVACGLHRARYRRPPSRVGRHVHFQLTHHNGAYQRATKEIQLRSLQ